MGNKRLSVKIDKLKGRLVPVPNLWGDSNAYSILAKCRRAARRRGWTEQEWLDFATEAKKGDYDDLIQTVMSKFDETTEDSEET